ncbi:MAG: hypothetical protein IRF12RH_00775 [Rickettsia helvetica]|uniref:Uncharacterized protein n=1 Tax=Rickettsia helvetica TaxID=35789 RepID=A0ABP0T3E4_RICHE
MNQYDNNSKKNNIDRTLILAKTLMKAEDLKHL